MINGLEGIPGSGKSYEAVAFHVIGALEKGRKVITNLPLKVDMFGAMDPRWPALIEIRRAPQPVRGTWDQAAAGRDEPAFRLFDDGHTEPAPQGVDLFGHVWDFYTDWKGPDGNGPLFIIDECHVPLPALGTPVEVVQWFKIHRHFNADVLLMTQSFRDMCQPIARLIAMLVKCRKADILGRADHYIRKVHGGYRGAVISTEQRKYKPEYFGLYRSHTQGNSVAEYAAQDVSPLLVKLNRAKWAVLLLGLVLAVWAFWPTPKPAAKPTPKPAWLLEVEANHGKPRPPIVDVDPPAIADKLNVLSPGAQAVGTDQQIPEPYANKALHVTGFMRMAGRIVYVFTVSENGAAITTVMDTELKRAGYVVTGIGDCVVTVQWRDRVRSLTCDAPSLAMSYQPTSKAPEAKAVSGGAAVVAAPTSAALPDSGLVETASAPGVADGAVIGAMRARSRP